MNPEVLIGNIVKLTEEIKTFNIECCSPSDDPDMQYAYSASFRDIAVRYVSMLRRLNDPIIDELLIGVNPNFNTSFIGEAHYLKSNLYPIFDYIDEIKDDKDYPIKYINENVFVDNDIINQLINIKNPNFDLSKLAQFLKELNINYKLGNYLSSILILRAIINHVPPIFGFKTFSEVVAQATKSTKSILQKLEDDARPIADLHSHMTIRKKEVLPTKQQIEPYKSSLEILLQEIICKMEE